MLRTTIIFALATIALANDLKIGTKDGRAIFNETIEASPAIWRQQKNVTVNATDEEVISKIVITDLRPEKDGEVQIVQGGEGQKAVTIELKSPTALRGFSFHIEVDVTPSKDIEHPSQTRIERQTTYVPTVKSTQFDQTTAKQVLDVSVFPPAVIGSGSTINPQANTEKYNDFKSKTLPTQFTTEFTTENIKSSTDTPKTDYTRVTREQEYNKDAKDPGYAIHIIPGVLPKVTDDVTQKSADEVTTEIIDKTTLIGEVKNAENVTNNRQLRETGEPKDVTTKYDTVGVTESTITTDGNTDRITNLNTKSDITTEAVTERDFDKTTMKKEIIIPTELDSKPEQPIQVIPKSVGKCKCCWSEDHDSDTGQKGGEHLRRSAAMILSGPLKGHLNEVEPRLQ